MNAVIMAGGEGKRLRPLTCDLPKPMARLLGRPALEYIMDLLLRHGVKNAAVTLRYLPDRITGHFPENKYKELGLYFVEENEPLGTAGSVKNACATLKDILGETGDVLVVSGDALCDFDLSAAMRFHRETEADATLVVKRVDDPREYGLVVGDESGAVTGFVEKPAFSQAVSDLANTGIYILSQAALGMIPQGANTDFAQDLFPLMLSKGMKLMCWESDGYWCDIGDMNAYISCQRDMLGGKVSCELNGLRDEHGNILADEQKPPPGALSGVPSYIGRGVTIEDGAKIENGCVLDDGAVVEHGARVTAGVLLQNSYVARRARLTGALLCAGAAVKAGAMLFEGAAVGAGAVVGEKAVVQSGVRIWNKKVVPDSCIVAENLKTGGNSKSFFDEDGITGQIGVELTPEFAARLGCAVGSLKPGSRVALGCGGNKAAAMLKSALAAGIQSTGSTAVDFGESFGSCFEYSMNFCSLGTGVFINGGSRSGIRVLGPGGLPAGRGVERAIETALSCGEFSRCCSESVGDFVEMNGVAAMYASQLLRFAPRGLSGCYAKVRSGSPAVRRVLSDALYKLGCDDDGGFTIEISSMGDKLRVFDERLGYIPHHKIFAWCAINLMKRGQSIAAPFDAPRILDEYASRLGVRLLRYLNCPSDESDREARLLAKAQMWSRDALMQAVMFMDMARQAGSLSVLLEQSPQFDRETRIIPTAANPASLIRGMGEKGQNSRDGRVAEGVLWVDERGAALLKPLKRGAGIRILAEALSSETAAELCDDIERRLTKKTNVDMENKIV